MTGARRNEIANGVWGEIDFESKTWTVPARATRPIASIACH